MQQIRVVKIKQCYRLCLAVILILLVFKLPLFAEPSTITELRSWFMENINGSRYQAYQARIEAVFLAAQESGLPLWILFDKLSEGVSKKVKGEVLATALEREYNQLLTIHTLFTKMKMEITDRVLYEEGLKTLSLFLSGGLDSDLLQALLTHSLALKQEPRTLLLLCEAVFKIKQASLLNNGQLLRLADALMGSSLPPAGYLSIASLFIKGKIKHIQEETLFVLITETLAGGGGLIQLNDELNRRIKK